MQSPVVLSFSAANGRTPYCATACAIGRNSTKSRGTRTSFFVNSKLDLWARDIIADWRKSRSLTYRAMTVLFHTTTDSCTCFIHSLSSSTSMSGTMPLRYGGTSLETKSSSDCYTLHSFFVLLKSAPTILTSRTSGARASMATAEPAKACFAWCPGRIRNFGALPASVGEVYCFRREEWLN